MQSRYRMPLDETEAYLRHRARVHEREKREKLKKAGKLEEYLAKIEQNIPKPEPQKEPEPKQEILNFDKIMESYLEVKKYEKENLMLNNVIQISVVEGNKNDETKKKKKIKRRKKKKIVEEEENEILLDDVEFKPQMAGNTGLPSIFFNNLVKQHKTAIQAEQARNRMNHSKHRKH